jgi:hypothetical protein
LTTSYTQNLIRSLTGAAGSAMYDITNDMYRSYLGDGDLEDAITRGAERYGDNMQRGAGVYRPLFGDYESVVAVRDNNWQQYNSKRDGIDRAMTVYQRDLRAPGVTSRSMPYQMQSDTPLPQFMGTRAAYVASIAQILSRETADVRQQLTQLGMQAESVRDSRNTPREDINRQLNDLTRQRRLMALYLLQRTRHYEDVISRTLGEDFDFEDFDPEAYRTPMTPTAEQPAPQ